MRKLQLLSFVAALVAAGSASAGETGKFYFKGEIGYNLSHGKVDSEVQLYEKAADPATNSVPKGSVEKLSTNKSANFDGASMAGGFGYNVSDEFRTDLVFDYKFKQKQDFGAVVNDKYIEHKFSRESWLLMMNFYYDFNNTSDWTPFINAGLGYGSTKVKDYNIEDQKPHSKNAFAWDIGGGISYKISDGMYTDLSYKLTSMKAESEYKNQEWIDKYPGKDFATVKLKTPDITHSINLGLRVEF